MVKNNDKEKYMYDGYEIAFDGKVSCSFNGHFTRNIIIFGVDNSSSSHTDNLKNYFLILCERDTSVITGSFGVPEKEIIININKAKTKFWLSLHYNRDKSYLYVNWEKICIFKSSNKINNFPSQFCLGSISNKFDYSDAKEMFLKGNVYDFLIVYGAINKSSIFICSNPPVLNGRLLFWEVVSGPPVWSLNLPCQGKHVQIFKFL